MKTLLIIAILGLSGCASVSAQQANYERSRDEIADSYLAEMFAPDCKQDKFQCPEMIYKSVLPAAYKKAALCTTLKAKKKEECSKELASIFEAGHARLALRYTHGDHAEAALKCQADPNMCDFGKMEFELMGSHNRHLAERMRSALAETDHRYLSNVLEERRQAELVRAASYRDAPRSVSCTANTVGSTTFANCH